MKSLALEKFWGSQDFWKQDPPQKRKHIEMNVDFHMLCFPFQCLLVLLLSNDWEARQGRNVSRQKNQPADFVDICGRSEIKNEVLDNLESQKMRAKIICGILPEEFFPFEVPKGSSSLKQNRVFCVVAMLGIEKPEFKACKRSKPDPSHLISSAGNLRSYVLGIGLTCWQLRFT